MRSASDLKGISVVFEHWIICLAPRYLIDTTEWQNCWSCNEPLEDLINPCSSRNIQNRVPRTMSRHLLRTSSSKSPQPLWAPVPVLRHTAQGTSVFLFVPSASCPSTGHHWKESRTILFASSFQGFQPLMRSPWTSSPPGWTALILSVSPHRRGTPLLVAFHWNISRMFRSLTEGSRTGQNIPDAVSPPLRRANG